MGRSLNIPGTGGIYDVLTIISREQAEAGRLLHADWTRREAQTGPVTLADRKAFIRAISPIYDGKPPKIHWCPSPLKAAIAVTKIMSPSLGHAMMQELQLALTDIKFLFNNEIHEKIARLTQVNQETSIAVTEELKRRASVISPPELSHDFSNTIDHACHGVQDADVLCLIDFVVNIMKINAIPAIRIAIEASRFASWFWLLKQDVVAVEHPMRIAKNEKGHVHSDSGPAIEYSDGFKIYCNNGKWIPAELVTNPKNISWNDVKQTVDTDLKKTVADTKVDQWSKTDTSVDTADERQEAAQVIEKLSGLDGLETLTEDQT